MAEITEEKQSNLDLQAQFTKAELFFDKNKKKIGIVAAVVVIIIGLFIAYKKVYIPQQNEEALIEMYTAHLLFDKDSLKLALEGGTYQGVTFSGLQDIADSYGNTDNGQLAKYMSGVCLLRMGRFEESIDMLESADVSDIMVATMCIGLIGDAKMELKEEDEALKYYLKAAGRKENKYTTPMYLKKAAMVYERKGELQEAIKLLERIKKEFDQSNEGRDADKHLARLKYKAKID